MMQVQVAQALGVTEHRDAAALHHVLDELRRPPGDDQIDVAVTLQKRVDVGASLEQDDGCVWGEAVDVLSGQQRRKYPLNYQMGNGHGKRWPGRPGTIHPPSTEIGVFGFYEHWRTCMMGA